MLRPQIIFLAALFILLARPVWADYCNSYDECLNNESKDYHNNQRDYVLDKQARYLKSIAYKLDEISKKLSPGKDTSEWEWVLQPKSKPVNVDNS